MLESLVLDEEHAMHAALCIVQLIHFTLITEWGAQVCLSNAPWLRHYIVILIRETVVQNRLYDLPRF